MQKLATRETTAQTNLTELVERYQNDLRIGELCDALKSDGAQVLAEGLIGSQQAFVLAAAYRCERQPHLYVAEDKEDAAYLQNDLAELLAPKPIRFLPDSFKAPMNFERLDNTNVLQRTDAINKIVSSRAKGEIVVTYPEALFEKVVSPEVLNAERIDITKDETLDADTMIDVMVGYGFERVDFVYEPGQFSVRGGIIDIFSFGNEWPYRIELFDDEVESIREFDPTTQLSVRNIESIDIVPNINTEFKSTQKVSLLEVLPAGTVVWVRSPQLLLEKLQQCYDRASEFADKVEKLPDEEQAYEMMRERAFLPPQEVLTKLVTFRLVTLKRLVGASDPTHTLDFGGSPQPSFNKNFKLLIENLQENSAAGITNYIFTENAKQVERFYSIFKDLGAEVDFHPILKALSRGYVDRMARVACYTDHEIFQRFHRYRLKRGFSKEKALNLRLLRELKPGDYVVHIDHGVGKYSGLEKIEVNGKTQESVRLFYLNGDVLYVGINSLHKISKYVGKDGTPPRVNKLGSDAWERLKRKTKKKVKDIAKNLIKLYAQRKGSEGHAFPPDGYLQNELEASFLYEDTPDQLSATNDVKEDMMKPQPMDRLICGDVGFGKTEIAIRAAMKAAVGGKQVAILVPTTILALQHYQTFKERLGEFGVSVDYVNRFKTAKQKREIFGRLESGELDLVIGTHAILSKKVKFKDLGLLIVDEEQKFGVAAKEKLRNLKVNVDTLTLTATPIPRTMQFSLLGARDLSVIRTPPPNRQPIHTEIRVFNDELIKDSIYYEIYRGGQVFFVHNRVKSLPDIAAMVQRLCPDVQVAMAHGQQEAKHLEQTLLEFIDHRYDVLVCTNIIETGLDIPNANTIIINNAHQFGMADLHQLRGRVGRSNKKAFCYLFCPPLSVLTPEARKRLRTLEEFSDLGSGFDIAMKDLDIRGAGDMLGAEQSGFISDIGYETYQKILDEAITELREGEFKELYADLNAKKRVWVSDVQIESDTEMMIPTDYVSSTPERLALYTELDRIENEEQLKTFGQQLVDRFGPLPQPVEELMDGLRLRWLCKELGFERLILKNNKLRCYFISNPQSPFFETETFQRTMDYISKMAGRKAVFKRTNKYLIFVQEGVESFDAAEKVLEKMKGYVG